MGHFTFWISPSLSGFAERICCNSQASRSNYRGYLHVLNIFIIIIIIDNRILNFLDCILIGIFHLVSSIFTGIRMEDTSKDGTCMDGTLLTRLFSAKYCLLVRKNI